MKLANIVNNVPICPVCGVPLGNLNGDYNLVSHEGKNYTKFTRYCNGSCMDKYTYYAYVTLDGTLRYSFKDDIKEVNDETL